VDWMAGILIPEAPIELARLAPSASSNAHNPRKSLPDAFEVDEKATYGARKARFDVPGGILISDDHRDGKGILSISSGMRLLGSSRWRQAGVSCFILLMIQ